jgi:hypothetical protein
MGLLVNSKGHPNTLVASQHGNRNAVKSGVFSPAVIGSRVEERERDVELLQPQELISDVLTSEIARLLVIRDAMDEALEEEGLRGRRGEPRTMLALRLRLNTRLLKTLEQLDSRPERLPASFEPELGPQEGPPVTLPERIAFQHGRESLELVSPEEFDPELFLATIVESDDPTVSVDDQIQARTMLARWHAQHGDFCACFTTRPANDGAEFRGWIEELREPGVTEHERDAEFAENVRALSRGERLEPRRMYAKTSAALQAVVAEGVKRATAPQTDAAKTEQTFVLDEKIWRAMLSSDPRTALRQRLKAFGALEKADAFRRCNCGAPKPKDRRLFEETFDSALAYLIRIVGGRDHRAAMAAVEFPEVYLAVRDAVEAAVRSLPDEDARISSTA